METGGTKANFQDEGKFLNNILVLALNSQRFLQDINKKVKLNSLKDLKWHMYVLDSCTEFINILHVGYHVLPVEKNMKVR